MNANTALDRSLAFDRGRPLFAHDVMKHLGTSREVNQAAS